MEFVHNIVKKIGNVHKIHNGKFSSLDRCFFNIKKKEDNKLYEFMLKKNIFNNTSGDKPIYELMIYNKPTEKWQELYDTDSKEEIIDYISKI